MEANDQHIVIIFKDLDKLTFLAAPALSLASHLKKGITFLYISEKSDEKTNHAFIQALEKLFQGNLSGMKAHIIPQLNEALVKILPDKFGGVMVLLEADEQAGKKSIWAKPQLMKLFRHSRLPYMLVRNEDTIHAQFQSVVLAMDSLKESKEKVLWTSYFGRFFGAKITVVTRIYKDEFLARQAKNNEQFVRKIFDSFDLQYEIQTFVDKIPELDLFAVDYAAKIGADLVIAMTTKNISIFDLFTGLPENKVALNPQKMPVLFLNSRDDLYVLCD